VLLTIVGASGAAILVISTVAAIVVPRFISKTDQAKMAAAKSDEATLVSELDSFRVDCGRYPTAKEGLNALQSAPPSLENKWKGPYATADVPNDPWGHPYVYRITNNGRNVSIESYGSDGQPGGEGSTSETDIVDRVD
jgi:general secretion pathway protein G